MSNEQQDGNEEGAILPAIGEGIRGEQEVICTHPPIRPKTPPLHWHWI